MEISRKLFLKYACIIAVAANLLLPLSNLSIARAKVSDTHDMTTAKELYLHLMGVKPDSGKEADEVPVTIQPLGNVRWVHVVNAFNQAVRADYKKVGFKPSR